LHWHKSGHGESANERTSTDATCAAKLNYAPLSSHCAPLPVGMRRSIPLLSRFAVAMSVLEFVID
jgi:hypothetical protein